MTVDLSGLLLQTPNGEPFQEKLLETLVGTLMEERNTLQMTFPTSLELMDSQEIQEDHLPTLQLLEDKMTAELSMLLLLTLNMETFQGKLLETLAGTHTEEMNTQLQISHLL